MGQRKVSLTQLVGFEGWKVTQSWFETRSGVRLLRRTALPRHKVQLVVALERDCAARCVLCGRARQRLHERMKSRRWQDLPAWNLTTYIEAAPVRLVCTHCPGSHVEALPFAEHGSHKTRRFEQQLAVEASGSPVSHVAAQHGLSWGAVQRAELAALRRWATRRKEPALRFLGLDEKWLGRRGKWSDRFVTIVSDLETGEPRWYGFGRREETVKGWLDTLSDARKKRIVLAAMDMHDPFRVAIQNDPKLGHVAIVHDPFHVTKRVSQAVDELRRQVFFRAGDEMRGIGRGARWLFLRAAERLSPAEKERLDALLRHNTVLARAYQIKEEMRHVLRSANRIDMARGLDRIGRRTQARRHKPLRDLHDSLLRHREPILALAEHRPPVGRIEALNNNWETLVRRGRGYRNLDYMFLKLRFMTANPIESHGAIGRFLALAEPPAPATLRGAA